VEGGRGIENRKRHLQCNKIKQIQKSKIPEAPRPFRGKGGGYGAGRDQNDKSRFKMNEEKLLKSDFNNIRGLF
jgi:hypothetical protein